jgi:AcrR family transcriptional regulator
MSVTVIKYNSQMARWEPDTRTRLEQAAMALYLERGFERTTVAEIAERAGLTERTFFRYFTDKREMLFKDSGLLQDHIANAVATAPDSAAPMEAVAAGLEAASIVFQQDVERMRSRQAIIATNAELQARELSKLTALAGAIADALRERGVTDSTAKLSAEAGIVIFKTAFERRISATQPLQDWSPLIRESLEELRGVMTGGQTIKRSRK